MKKWFIVFISDGENRVYNDVIEFGEIEDIEDIRDLEDIIAKKWFGDSGSGSITIINYTEIYANKMQ